MTKDTLAEEMWCGRKQSADEKPRREKGDNTKKTLTVSGKGNWLRGAGQTPRIPGKQVKKKGRRRIIPPEQENEGEERQSAAGDECMNLF